MHLSVGFRHSLIFQALLIQLDRSLYRGGQVEFAFDELMSLESLERNYVMHVLNALEFNKLRTAEVLGIDPSTLYRKLSLWGLESSPVASPSGQRSPPDGPPQVPQNAPRAH